MPASIQCTSGELVTSDPPLPLQFLTRPGCHLCDSAWWVVSRVAGAAGVAVQCINVEEYPELRSQYGDHVPVLLQGGSELARHRVDERTLRWQLGIEF